MIKNQNKIKINKNYRIRIGQNKQAGGKIAQEEAQEPETYYFTHSGITEND